MAPPVVAFALGFGLAFAGSVPMAGPLALLMLDRIIAGQKAAAFWISFAGAIVEGVVALLVAVLLPLLLLGETGLVDIMRASGAAVILAVGVLLMIRPSLLETIKTERRQHSLLAGFLITALNPTLFATWTVTLTALYSTGAIEAGYLTAIGFGAGVAAGALGWSVLVLLSARFWRVAPLTNRRRDVGRAIGALLTLIGTALLVRMAV